MSVFRCAVALLAMLIPVAAHAAGTVKVQQVDGSVQVYPGSTMRVGGGVLRLTSADKKGTLVITDAACSFVGKLLRCLPYSCILDQRGNHRIPLAVGTIYFNTTNEAQQLSYSSTRIPPGGVFGMIRTVHGTYVTITGKLDGGYRR